MLPDLARQLDDWIIAENVEADEEGFRAIGPAIIKVLGQTALLEADCGLTLAATQDLDAYLDCDYAVEKRLGELLKARGKQLDPLGSEIWMPQETSYTTLFESYYVTVLLADVDAVLLSKALKAPHKNRPIILQVLARGASERFLSLAEKYELDLEQFLAAP